MEEAKFRLYNKGKDCESIIKYHKALKWLFFLI